MTKNDEIKNLWRMWRNFKELLALRELSNDANLREVTSQILKDLSCRIDEAFIDWCLVKEDDNE